MLKRIIDSIVFSFTHNHDWKETGQWTYDWIEEKCADSECGKMRYIALM